MIGCWFTWEKVQDSACKSRIPIHYRKCSFCGGFFKFWVFYFLITSQKFNVFYQFRYFLSFRLVVVFWISSVQLVGICGLSISAVLWLVRIWGHEVPVISLCTAWFRTQFCPWFFRHDLKSQIDRYKNVCVSKTFAEKLWLITKLITHQ